MIKILITRGKWQNYKAPQILLWENCSNPKCKTGRLHYAAFLTGPNCPDCRTKLIGKELTAIQHYGRLTYHLEAA